jgi:ligand-binding sensor domain-containing protein
MSATATALSRLVIPLPARASSIAVTPDGAVWFSFGFPTPIDGQKYDGVIRLQGQEMSHFSSANGLPGDNVQALKVAPDGVLWMGAGCKVAYLDGQGWQVVNPGCEIMYTVLDMAFTPDGAVWVATPFRLARFDGQTWTYYDKMLNNLAAAPNGDLLLWGSGWQGLQNSFFVGRFDGADWATFDMLELHQAAPHKMVVTPDGLAWGATGQRGVACFDGQAWKFYTTADGLPSDAVKNLAVAPDGAVWAITDQGVARFDGQKWLLLDGVPGSAYDLAFAPDGSAWFLLPGGVFHFSGL